MVSIYPVLYCIGIWLQVAMNNQVWGNGAVQ